MIPVQIKGDWIDWPGKMQLPAFAISRNGREVRRDQYDVVTKFLVRRQNLGATHRRMVPEK